MKKRETDREMVGIGVLPRNWRAEEKPNAFLSLLAP